MLVQPEKAASPIEVTESGRSTDTRLLHPKKAYSPISAKDFDITIDVKLQYTYQTH